MYLESCAGFASGGLVNEGIPWDAAFLDSGAPFSFRPCCDAGEWNASLDTDLIAGAIIFDSISCQVGPSRHPDQCTSYMRSRS